MADIQSMDSAGQTALNSSEITAENQNVTSENQEVAVENQVVASESQEVAAENQQAASESQDFENNTYDSLYESYSEIPNAPEVTSLAFSTSDLNGDNASDLLVMNISSEAETQVFNSTISALSGYDGSILWQKEYPGALAFVMPVGDINGDGKADVMVDEIIAEQSLGQLSCVSVLDGSSGIEIWSRPQQMAMTFAYPVKDIDGDEASEILEHTFGVDSLNNSISTRISRISGATGTAIDERIFSGSLAIEYPAGNLTTDSVPDSIVAIYQMNESMTSETEDALMNITATTFEAIDGQDHTKLWEQSFDGPALAMPEVDLTGDGLNEVAVYLVNYDAENQSTSNDIAMLQGDTGELLWQKSFAGAMAFAVAAPDLTGEGQRDLIIYKLEGSGEGGAETQAIKGDDGRMLWNRTSMTYIPSEFMSQNFLSNLAGSSQ
jgi:hypothetical protein